VARLHEADPSTLLWGASVLAVLVVWAIRVRRAVAVGDEATGFALTAVVGCLVSPITWVHHLVWLMPAILLLLDRAVATTDPRRRKRLWGFTIFSYLLLCSRLVWTFADRWGSPLTWLASNAYVWISLALLIALPIRTPAPQPEPEVETSAAEGDRALAGSVTPAS
jgi:alpha-1,2-mannosyltransferase